MSVYWSQFIKFRTAVAFTVVLGFTELQRKMGEKLGTL